MIKKILIAILVIVVIFSGLVAFQVYKDFQEEKVLNQEIVRLTNKDLVKDNFNVSIKTKGDYAFVESAIKNYYKDLSDSVKNINYYANDSEIYNVLTLENLNKDRPEFNNSYKIINDASDNIVGSVSKIASMCDKDYIEKLVTEDKVSDYYVKYYRRLMYTEEDLKKFNDIKEEMESTSNNLKEFFDKIKEIFNMLKNNNDNWFIKDDKLYFTDGRLVDEYNRLYGELRDIAVNKLGAKDEINDNIDIDASV